MDKEFFVYVLLGENGVLYKGQTANIENRLKEHLRGDCRTTRLMNKFKLVFVQICENRKSARELEKYLKSGFGRENINEIISNIWGSTCLPAGRFPAPAPK